MANPQKENGYTAIANEILKAMQRTHWTEYEIRVIFCILEKTYGWHKKDDWISLSQMSKMTGILSQHISRTIKKLLIRKIIKKNKKRIGFNKNYEEWTGFIPNEVLPNEVGGVTQRGIKNIPNEVTTQTTTKETIQKKDDKSFKRKKYVDINWGHPYTKAGNKFGKFRLFKGKDNFIYAQIGDGSFIRKSEVKNNFKKHI